MATTATAANFSFAFGTQGRGDGQFFNPRGIALDSSGNIFVADTFNNRVQVFAQDNTNTVPEPLTILGSATALGFGAFFKRKLAQAKE